MADAYAIGVAIALHSNGMEVLGSLSNGLKLLDRAAVAATGKMDALKAAALGAVGMVAGAGIVRGMGVLVEHGAKLVEQQAEMKRLGVSNAEIADATGASWKAAGDVLGSSVVRNLQVLREAKGALGTVDEAKALLPDLVKADVLMGHNDRGLQMVMKAIEMRGDVRYDAQGNLDVEYARHGLDAAIKFFTASGGQVDAQGLRGLIAQAGPMAKMMDPDAFYRTMLTITEELGGQKAGTAISAAGRALYGGIMPQRNSKEMERLGLLNPDMVHVERGGNVRVDQGALTGLDVLNSKGLIEWTNSVLRPMLHRDFLVEQGRHPELTEAQYNQQELYRLFPTETFRRLAGIALQQEGSVAKGAANFDQAQGLAGYNTAINENPATQMKAFKEAWDNLLTALGAPMVTTAYSMLGKLTLVLNDLAQWAAAHPQMVESIGTVTVAFGGLLGVGGVLAVGGAALSALGVLAGPIGLIGLAAGIGAVALAMDRFHGQPAPAGPNGMRSEAADNAPRPPQQTWAERISEMLPTARQVADGFKDFVPRVLFALSDSVLAVGDAIGHSARRLFDALRDDAMLGLRSLASTLSDKLGEISRAILDWIAGLPGAVAGAVGGAVGDALHGFNEAIRRGASGAIAPGDPVADAVRRRGAPNPGPDGQPYYRPQSFVPPPAGAGGQAPQRVSLQVDRRTFAEISIDSMGRVLDRPQYGQVAFDPSMSPRYGGAAYAA